LLWDRPRQMLHISRQPAGGFTEAIHERRDLGPPG
jgi:hypothetical protein